MMTIVLQSPIVPIE